MLLGLFAILIVAGTVIIWRNPTGIQTAKGGSNSSSSVSTSAPTLTTIGPRSQIAHVIVLVLENQEYGSVLGNKDAPYQNYLAGKYALATNYYAVSHPSEPNYIAMIAGSTLGISNDGSVAANQRNATNLVGLLRSKGISWKAYEESMPSSCNTLDSTDGLYLTQHDPFVYMTDITNNQTYCRGHVVSLTQFYADLASAALPQYSFITPNARDDGHYTNLSVADNWLSTFVPQIINSTSFASTALFLVYDEGTTNMDGGGHVMAIAIGPNTIVKPRFQSNDVYTHYSLLATIESIYSLGNLGRNDTAANTMKAMFATLNSAGP